MSLLALNRADAGAAASMLRQCCTSERWISALVEARPYTDEHTLHATADSVWGDLEEADYLQSFDGHPRIGDVNSLKAKYADTKALAEGEQASVTSASDEVIASLAQGNADYEHKFGFIFIVCASGKSATEMLSLLQDRLPNSREKELLNAAEEQRKIFHLRLEKLL